ncbi:alpha-E domain-containing protein [Alteribacter keqinensis]|uniref:alpha-E domain-containing protein n=1 Tax=Alteribacter keqinensis TaxID=2483800 RepID=UPI002017FFEC|nr:alpha-E domain-containing protein [Alteribacter keqinensis]
MLSRVADSLYWMARNIERAENNSRVLSARLINMLEASDTDAVAERDWEEVIEICASFSDYKQEYSTFNPDTIVQYLAFQEQNPNSLANCIGYARDNAKSAREIIPHELWECLNECYWNSIDVDRQYWNLKEVDHLLREIKLMSFTTQGVIESSMTRDETYTFIQIGKWLERAEKTARILNVMCEKARKEAENPEAHHYYYWLAALQFVNGHDAYLKKYPPTISAKDVLAFLITDGTFPRSIQYCVNHVWDAVKDMEGGKVSHYSEELFDAIERVKIEFDEMKIKDLQMHELGEFLDQFQDHCNNIGRIFSKTYYLIEPADSSVGVMTQFQN